MLLLCRALRRNRFALSNAGLRLASSLARRTSILIFDTGDIFAEQDNLLCSVSEDFDTDQKGMLYLPCYMLIFDDVQVTTTINGQNTMQGA